MNEEKGVGDPVAAGRLTCGVQELELLGVHAKRVERPSNEKETQEIVAGASREGLSVLPCGGGTAMGVGVLPETVDIALDTTGLNRVLAFDPNNLNVAVLGGITMDALNGHLANEEKGFFLPLDPPQSHRATIGGVYASNASGPCRLMYGTIRDLALGVRGVNAKGEEVGFGGKTVKNVSGLDMTRFLVGSAGCLGVVTSISFRVLPLPEAASLCEVRVDEEDAAASFLSALRASVLLPSAIVVDGGSAGSFEPEPDPVGFRILVAFEGHPAAVERQNRDLLEMAQKSGGSGDAQPGRSHMVGCLRRAVDPEESGACLVTLKVAVPIARGLHTYAALRRLSRESGVPAQIVLLAGNGIAYVHLAEGEQDALNQLLRGAREIAAADGGHVNPIRAPRRLLAHWGPRVNPTLDRLVLHPIKEKLDPTGVFPPII